MKSFINILIYEKDIRIIIHLAYVANCTSTGHLREYIVKTKTIIIIWIVTIAVALIGHLL
jgi:hypothetical protein